MLKKQNYREADQIVTIWTEELGKLRCLARGIRKPSSKLVYNLQNFSLVSFEVSGRHLPVLTSCQTLQNFRLLYHDLGKIAAGCYAAELMLKLTADEHPNPKAYELLHKFFEHSDKDRLSIFCSELLEALGFSSKTSSAKLDFQELNQLIEEILERKLKSSAFLRQIA